MFKYKYIWGAVIIIFATLLSCNNNQSSNYPETSNKPVSAEGIAVKELKKVAVDSTISTSLVGKLEIMNGKLCYIDYLFCYMYFISDEGLFLNRELGIGNGPNEINCGAINTYSILQNGDISFFGSSDDVYIYSPSIFHKKESSFRLNRDYSRMRADVEKDPAAFETYTFPRFIVCRSYGNKAYINNSSTAQGFNYFETPDKYSQYCRLITEYDIPGKKIGRLMGQGLPAMYKGTSSRHYVFSEFTFDIDSAGNFYLSFLADSLIYKFNKDFIPVASFGYKGKNMDTDYHEIIRSKDIYPKANEQYETKGWYTWIEYIPEKNWVCRSYHRGGPEKQDGLQIYENNVLIADITVPKGFKPIGYIHPYLYSDAVVENEKLLFYKIELN